MFDGVCNLCNGFVKFVIERDKKNLFKFASLQSDAGKNMLQKFNLPAESLTTLILLRGDKYFIKSNAFFEVVKQLGGGWKMLLVLKIFPRAFRDFVYDGVASIRYKVMGKRETCMVPTKEISEKFIL